MNCMRALLGPARLDEWRQLGPRSRLNALLGDQWWGAHAETGDERMNTYLEELEKARRAHAGSTDRDLHTTGNGARAHGSGYG